MSSIQTLFCEGCSQKSVFVFKRVSEQPLRMPCSLQGTQLVAGMSQSATEMLPSENADCCRDSGTLQQCQAHPLPWGRLRTSCRYAVARRDLRLTEETEGA